MSMMMFSKGLLLFVLLQLSFFKRVGSWLVSDSPPLLRWDQYTALHLAAALWPMWHGWADHHLKPRPDFFQSIQAKSTGEFRQLLNGKQPQPLNLLKPVCLLCFHCGERKFERWALKNKGEKMETLSVLQILRWKTSQYFFSQCHSGEGMIRSF